jgi:hypothetical protein
VLKAKKADQISGTGLDASMKDDDASMKEVLRPIDNKESVLEGITI